MSLFQFRKYSLPNQYLISILLVVTTSVMCYFSVDLIGYRIVALLLLFFVSFLAMVFDIFPVLLTAILSAFIWNFFFIPPTFTFHIGTPEDTLMFMMYFVIASINEVLTFKIRQIEKKRATRKKKKKPLHFTIRCSIHCRTNLEHQFQLSLEQSTRSVKTNQNSAKLPSQNYMKK